VKVWCGRRERSLVGEFAGGAPPNNLAAHSFSAKSTKAQIEGQEKSTSLPEILRTARFLEKTCKQEFFL